MFWKTAGRVLIVIPFALLVAALASAFVLVTLGLERATAFLHVNPIGDEDVETVFAMVNQGAVLAASITIIPALLMVVVGEVARIRALAYYVIGGGLALAAVPLLARYGQAGTVASSDAIVWQVFATAGFAGGFMYWLIAGRNA
ncbi:hypothetical protein [Hyphomicrobium sulfonivorans]|uniref:Uncharacterized protein n=1 Tax=Hyphomicrobium sulfonivorans TaxID=121290 RepID=A0A120CUH9_HYPSL|nr:hypothetical protein [Hyphomicrobium sulfonivorans]KWT66265.1 hypothetical protein APY04_2461 [Hyphomicrobium sulfonivorans]MBI1648584.1 hypothetical protein [Hyphomicrobium sulfonivorans]NSL70878.1 hypothetical protein [Hyphomicrobium sulfonivorans]